MTAAETLAATPFLNRSAGQFAQRRLSRQPGENGQTDLVQLSQICEQLDIVCWCFTEAETRVDNKQVTVDTSVQASLYPIFKKLCDVLGHILVLRAQLA